MVVDKLSSDMALLCLFGVCIPYSVIWPFILLFLKQIWEYVSPTKRENKNSKNNSDGSVDSQCFTKPEQETSNNFEEVGSVLGSVYLDKSMDWEKIIESERKTVVRFTASWCKPCKELEPVFDTLSKRYSDKATFISVDVDEFDELSAKYAALSIPLFLCLRKGKELQRMTGRGEDKLISFVDECLKNESLQE